ncbi:hypothetical protein ACP4OV_023231 [Aristida adscensionis]
MDTSQRSRSFTAAAAAVVLDDDDDHGGRRGGDEAPGEEHQLLELRRGPWTVDEDLTLVNYIADHGEGRWNSLARAAGLKRTGKSCRLRWLNYLRPDVKRGNFTADEQLLILDLHSRWGNRWSKIAQHLPGRTDNEIKNYWRTRVQKHAKQLNCDANSARFKDAMRYLWMPHLAAGAAAGDHHHHHAAVYPSGDHHHHGGGMGVMSSSSSSDSFASEMSYDGGLFASVHAGEMLVNAGGGDHWVPEASQGMWCDDQTAAAAAQALAVAGGQFQDPELSGWVQGFSEGMNENFWALEDIWKMQ